MQAEKEHARALLEKAAAKLKSTVKGNFRITTEVLKGMPEEAIIDEAKKWDADL